MSIATVEKMKLTNKNAPKGYPTDVVVENHLMSTMHGDQTSVALFTIFEGIPVLGFSKKGKKTMKAFGLSDMAAILAVRNWVLNLSWTGKPRDAIITKELLSQVYKECNGDLEKMLASLKLL